MNRDDSFRRLCSSLDVDDELLEILLPYLDKLLLMGIDLNHLPLQQAIEGHTNYLETACRALIGYAGRLASRGDRFNSNLHATRCFIKALVDRWEPYANWDEYAEMVAQTRYINPYQRARTLIYELSYKDGTRIWNPEAIEPLSDQEIEALIPSLEAELNAIER